MFLLVFHDQEPGFGRWSIDYNFAEAAPASADRGVPPPGVRPGAEQPATGARRFRGGRPIRRPRSDDRRGPGVPLLWAKTAGIARDERTAAIVRLRAVSGPVCPSSGCGGRPVRNSQMQRQACFEVPYTGKRRVSERISGIPCPHGCRDRHASHRRDAARGRYFRATGYGPRPRYRGRVLRGHVGVGHPRGSSSGLGQSGAAACPVGRRRCAYCRDGRRELVGTAGRLSRRARGHLASPSNDLPRRVVRPVAVAWPYPPTRFARRFLEQPTEEPPLREPQQEQHR